MHERASRDRLVRDITPMGKLLWWLGAVRYYRDGDHSIHFVCRWWHPLTWALFPAMVVACGFMETTVQEQLPMRLPKHYRDGTYPLEWLK